MQRKESPENRYGNSASEISKTAAGKEHTKLRERERKTYSR
jgi:hypothetical protein